MGRNMWKCVFGHMRTVQSDQGLRGPQTESLDIIKCFNGEWRPGWDFAHARYDVNLHMLRMLDGTFLLARYILCNN